MRVESYSFTRLNMKNLYYHKVSSEEEYLSRCRDPDHKNCMGHLCLNPAGIILYPGAMCSVIGDIKDKFYECTRPIVMQNTHGGVPSYHERLRQLLMSKEGILRGKCCSGFVEGSIRMVILPSWELSKDEIFIPRYVKGTLKVPTRIKNGKISAVYEYGEVNEGDYAIVIRPPTLWEGNAQPKRIRFWDRTAIGISPEVCADYHADFDGDEMQVYVVKDLASVDECKAWTMQSKDMFDYQKIEEELAEPVDDCRSEFMQGTTITFREALEGIGVTYSMKVSKVKSESLTMLGTMMDNMDDEDYFIDESIRGMKDIMVQQLNQGNVGKILRMARVASQDFLSMGDVGAMHISDLPYEIDRTCLSAGLPAARLVSKIGSLVQQAYLDAHRANVEASGRYNLAMSFIEGRSDTILICNQDVRASWKARMPNGTVLARVDLGSFTEFNKVIGTYSTRIVMRMSEDRRRDAVRLGVEFIVKYYNISTTSTEVEAVVDMILVVPREATMQATTGKGVSVRPYRWLTKVIAQHWKRLPSYVSELDTRYPVETVVEACMFGNFSSLPSVLECDKS